MVLSVPICFVIGLHSKYIDRASMNAIITALFFMLPLSLIQVLYTLDQDHVYWIHIHLISVQFIQITTVFTFSEYRGNSTRFVS